MIAAITSCTNTSNPSVMLGAALLAKQRRREGPDLQAVGEDHDGAGLAGGHRLLRQGRPVAVPGEARLLPGRLRLHHVHRQHRPAARGDLARRSTTTTSRSTAVLSGNRNFEGRINPDVKMNYLASPPLVIAYALAGTMDFDFETEPLGTGRRRQRRLPEGHLAVAEGHLRHHRLVDQPEDVHQELRRRLQGRRALAQPAHPGGQHLRVGRRTRPTCASPRTSTACPPSRRRSPTSPAPECLRCWVIR